MEVKMSSNILGSEVIVQIGIVVKDIEKSAKEFSEIFNVPIPEIIITDEYEKAHTEYKGKPTNARAKLAFFNFKNIDIELIEPDNNPSTWREFLDAEGEGVHHIAVFVKGMDEKIEILKNFGMNVIQRGDFTGGRYAYIDSTSKLKIILELLEIFS
jgi:hypothetical protein